MRCLPNKEGPGAQGPGAHMGPGPYGPWPIWALAQIFIFKPGFIFKHMADDDHFYLDKLLHVDHLSNDDDYLFGQLALMSYLFIPC